MAKRNKGNPISTFFAILFLIAVFCLGLFALIPFYFIGNYLKSLKYLSIRKNLRNDYSDFWLSSEEQEAFVSAALKLKNASEQKQKAIRRAEQANLSQNIDGSYNRRSNLGKEINEIIEEADIEIYYYSDIYSDYKYLPYNRWKKVKKLKADYEISGTATHIFFISMFLLVYMGETNLIYPGWNGVFHLLHFIALLFLEILVTPFVFLADVFDQESFKLFRWPITLSLATSVAALLQYFIEKFKSFSPEPPEVTLDNYRDYSIYSEDFDDNSSSNNDGNCNSSSYSDAAIKVDSNTLFRSMSGVGFLTPRVETIIYDFLAIIYADEEKSEAEHKQLETLCEVFEITMEDIEKVGSKGLDKVVIPKDPKDKLAHLLALVSLALVDGELHPKAQEYCEQVAKRFDFDQKLLPDIFEIMLDIRNGNKTEKDFEIFVNSLHLEEK